MTLQEVEDYYGKEAADWVRCRIAAGMFKPPVVTVRLKNPKYKRGFMKFNDAVKVRDWDTLDFELPDEVRFSDIVQVEIETESAINDS